MTDHIADVSKMVADNPGIQGLAQLGRNAIERVTELEADNAELIASIAMIARAIGVDERAQIGDLLSRLHALLAERDALEIRAEQADARLAAIDAQPTVAVVCSSHSFGQFVQQRFFGSQLPRIGTELIARPAKEAK